MTAPPIDEWPGPIKLVDTVYVIDLDPLTSEAYDWAPYRYVITIQ